MMDKEDCEQKIYTIMLGATKTIWLVVGGSGVSPYELVWVAFGTNADLLLSLIHPWSPYPDSHIITMSGLHLNRQ